MTNRELAAAIIVTTVMCALMVKHDVRDALRNLLRSVVNWKVLAVIGVYAVYVALWVWLANYVGFWNLDLIGDTVVWFVLAGFPLLFKFDEAGRDERFFRKTALSTIELGVFFGFFVNLVSLSLIGELVLQPVLVVLVMMRVLAAHESKYERTKGPIDFLLGLIVLAMSSYSLVSLFQQRDILDAENTVLSLLMTVWLPIVSLGFLFAFSLFAGYELVFVRMKSGKKTSRVSLKAKLAIVTGLNLHLREVHGFAGGWAARVKSESTFRAAVSEVRPFRAQWRRRVYQERQVAFDLRRYTGVVGADDKGRPLDKREFVETMDVLRWIASCQMGQYRNNNQRYRVDLMNVLGDFTSHGLPKEHGIVMKVRSDGQAWYAWRRTITGWVFAIGSASKPSDQWLYDGSGTPSGYPSVDAGWDHFVAGYAAINWR